MGIKQLTILFVFIFLVGSVSAGLVSENKWNIEKTGAETNLDITYETISDTQTRFCIEYGDTNKKNYYKNAINDLKKDIKKIPLTKISGNLNIQSEVNLDKNTKDKSCFVVSYPEYREDLSFKIGWNSVLIEASGGDRVISPASLDNLCIMDNGVMYAVWEDGGDDLWIANSTNNGANWTNMKEFPQNNPDSLQLLCGSGGNMAIKYDQGGDTFLLKSTDYFATNTSITLDAIGDIGGCVIDSNNIVHCCAIGSSDRVEYVNSSNLTIVPVIDAGTHGHCVMGINSSDNLFILADEYNNDDLYLLSSSDGFSSNVSIPANSFVIGDNNYPAMFVTDSEIYIAYQNNYDLWFANGTYENGFSSKALDGDNSYYPTISKTANEDLFIFYSSGSTDAGDVYYANSTDNGLSWSIRTPLVEDASSGWATMMTPSLYSGFTEIIDTIYFLYIKSEDVYFSTLSVQAPIEGDGDVPVVNIVYPIEATYSNNITELKYTATDDTGLDSCWWSDDLGDTNNSITCGENLTGQNWGNGTTLYVYANDTGNQLGFDSVIFYVDATNPNAILNTPANDTRTNVKNQNLTANLSDDTALNNATLYVYNSTGGIFNSTFINGIVDTTTSVVGVVIGFVDGVYNWFYKVFDKAGNLFTSENNTITIDSTKPTVTLTSPNDGLTTTTATQTFEATSSDSLSDLDTGIFYIWNSTNNLINTTTDLTPATMSIEFVLPAYDEYKWNYYVNDSLGNDGFATSNRTITYQAEIEPINWTETNNCYIIGNLSTGEVMTKICNNGYVYMTSPNGTKYRCGVTNTGGWSCSS